MRIAIGLALAVACLGGAAHAGSGSGPRRETSTPPSGAPITLRAL